MAEKKKLNPWRDAPGLGQWTDPRDKGDFAGDTFPNKRRAVEQMDTGRAAMGDEAAGRVTSVAQKKRKKDQSRYSGE